MSLLKPRRGHLPVLLQSEATECGLACLAMVASHHGHDIDLGTLRRRFPVSLKGTTLRHLIDLAQRLKLTSRPLKLELESLKDLQVPCILHWDMSHFVVLKSVRRDRIVIHDPAAGERRYTLKEASRHFTGVALELTPTSDFERKRERARLPMSALWGRVTGVRRALLQTLVLTVLLQVFVLASPFYMQLVVDEAILRGDHGLLLGLAIGFGLLTIINVVATALRTLILANMGTALGFGMSANLFHHLIRLPMPWYEKRHVGDVISRFGSLDPIRQMLTEGIVAVLVDGGMALLTLAMIFVYSPPLAGIVLGVFLVYATFRAVAFPVLRRRSEEQIHASAAEDTTFIETVRAVQSVKLFGREADREGVWQNRFAEVLRRGLAVTRLNAGFAAFVGLLYGLENIAVVYIGAKTVIGGGMTVGMLYAFMSYKQQFLDKATNLLTKAVEWRMLDLHLDRLGDIATAEREGHGDRIGLVEHRISGGIEVRGLSFRYADGEPDVLHDIDLAIGPGEFVAITGPSGCGKSTLMKVMLGLVPVTRGEIRVDGIPMGALGIEAFRAQIGVVMQDDHLLGGSIADNICFFDASPDLALMRASAMLAGIDGEIMAMPMNYNTLIGEMGAALSGGQRQRVLLARALYRRPRILFMDEGTSHLDVAKEREVNLALAQLRVTRVVIAHRPETIRAADRIVQLVDGRIVRELRPTRETAASGLRDTSPFEAPA